MGYAWVIYSVYSQPRIINFHQELTEIWPIFVFFTFSSILNQFCSKKILFIIKMGN
jgi:hypothetical protein